MKVTRFRLPLILAALVFLVARESRAEATWKVGNVVAARGETSVLLPISAELDPSEQLFVGFQLTVEYDPRVMASTSVVVVGPPDFYRHLDQLTYSEPGNVGAAVLWEFNVEGGIDGVEQSGIFAHVRFCVPPDAPEGTYPVRVLASAERRLNNSPSMFETVYTTADGVSNRPHLMDGSITIVGTADLPGACPRDDHGPLPPPPPPPPLPDVLQATFSLPDASARPGGNFTLPFTINPNAEVPSFSISIDFDEEILSCVSANPLFERTDGKEKYDFTVLTINNSNDVPGNGGVDEGFIAAAIIFSFDNPPVVLPRDKDTEVLALQFAVAPAASAGLTEVKFLDGASVAPSSPAISNVATIYDRSIPPDTKASMTFVNGLVGIVGDASAFVRGDSNGDGQVNISDPIHTLSYLFLGGPAPICFDAADANDDGQINVSDAIRSLGTLFLGDPSLPPPTVEPDFDPTPDGMTCLTR